ncbi:MAG: hypothetical protein M3N41_14600 [Acidobacteriota bacterium]|nr:hypothetical protein [Acidobacteriota bacterium]
MSEACKRPSEKGCVSPSGATPRPEGMWAAASPYHNQQDIKSISSL